MLPGRPRKKSNLQIKHVYSLKSGIRRIDASKDRFLPTGMDDDILSLRCAYTFPFATTSDNLKVITVPVTK